MDKTWTIAVTGAAGHVGGKLVEALRSSGMTVRALTRADGDVGDGAAMRRALDGVDAAFYLVHSLGSAGEFAAGEQRDAREFGAAARHCAVQRLVYLGGIAHGDDLSPHLQSRCDVGNTLRSSGVPTVELRASIVIGEGSASFEIVRDLVDRLPALVAPDWLENAAQPIAIDDVVAYLVAALDESIAPDAVYEIGGRDRVTYRDLVEEIALQAGSAMPIATVPVPRLPGVSQLPEWMAGLVPERARLAANLIESMRFDTAVEDDAAQRDFDVEPVGLREAVAAALATA
jgi:uncharacterized protein YbjT (DUF2867 family)